MQGHKMHTIRFENIFKPNTTVLEKKYQNNKIPGVLTRSCCIPRIVIVSEGYVCVMKQLSCNFLGNVMDLFAFDGKILQQENIRARL